MIHKKYLMAGLAVVVLSGAVPGLAHACMPASEPRPTAEEFAARQASLQADWWARSDTVVIATVTGSDVSDRTLRVTLAPSLLIKGETVLPDPFEVSDHMTNCRPGGIMGAGGITVGEVYVVYRQSDGDLVVHQDSLVDPATRSAWDEARPRVSLSDPDR